MLVALLLAGILCACVGVVGVIKHAIDHKTSLPVFELLVAVGVAIIAIAFSLMLA